MRFGFEKPDEHAERTGEQVVSDQNFKAQIKEAKKLKIAGANSTVSPDEIGGKKMASVMISPNIQYFVDNIIDTKNVSIDMEEVAINESSELIGKQLRDTKISDRTGLIVLAIRRANDQFIFNPKLVH